LTGKLVLLGGTYQYSDQHFTALGETPGVKVLADAIQTELLGPHVQPYAKLALLVEIVTATVLAVILHNWLLKAILLIGVPIILGISLLFVTFDFLSLVLYFVPMLFVVLIYEIFEYMRHQSVLHVRGD
jgi:hypothetical protein